jgi:FkbM family methyltransferase
VLNESDVSKIHHTYYCSAIPNKNGVNDNVKCDEQILEKISVENFKFIVHKNDTCVADCLRSGQLFEKFLVSYLRHFINPNKNVLDLGANIGTHSVIYSNYIDSNSTVYSFEPQKVVFDILVKNIELNNCKNVIPFNFGCSNVNNVFYMNACYENKDNHGAFRIDSTLNEANGLKIECKVLDELGITNVGYVKIDVEGHEYEALLGMKTILLRDKPVIMIEIHDSCPTKNDTITLLVELGYVTHYKLSHCDYIFVIPVS